MLNLERHAKILELIDKRGKVEVGELSHLFKISEVTIRNDLKDLHKRGLVRRAHGGAVRIATVSVDASLQVKAAIRADEKQRIGPRPLHPSRWRVSHPRLSYDAAHRKAH
jgi:DeoR/GlpR family transcriptional regulator of sugar metabolism